MFHFIFAICALYALYKLACLFGWVLLTYSAHKLDESAAKDKEYWRQWTLDREAERRADLVRAGSKR